MKFPNSVAIENCVLMFYCFVLLRIISISSEGYKPWYCCSDEAISFQVSRNCAAVFLFELDQVQVEDEIRQYGFYFHKRTVTNWISWQEVLTADLVNNSLFVCLCVWQLPVPAAVLTLMYYERLLPCFSNSPHLLDKDSLSSTSTAGDSGQGKVCLCVFVTTVFTWHDKTSQYPCLSRSWEYVWLL